MPPSVACALVETSTGNHSPCGRSCAFSVIEHDAGLHDRRASPASTAMTLVQVLGVVDDQRRADRLAALRAARAARQNRARLRPRRSAWRRARLPRCAARRRRPARSGRSTRRWSSGRGWPRRTALRRRARACAAARRAAHPERGALMRTRCIACGSASGAADRFRHGAYRLSALRNCSKCYPRGPMTRSGRHFLQIPGPTNVPDRVLRAIDFPTMDHRGPEFADARQERARRHEARVQDHAGRVVIYPASGTGAWEAALVNTLSPGDRVLMAETGHFASAVAEDGAAPRARGRSSSPGDWRHGADPDAIEKRAARRRRQTHQGGLRGAQRDLDRRRVAHRRRAQGDRRARGIPALFMVDTISSLASIDYRHDEWGVDVTVAGSQKGLMLPPGPFVQLRLARRRSPRPRRRACRAATGRGTRCSPTARAATFPYTPATNLLYGLREALTMLLDEEGLDAVFARHQRHAEATRRAVRAWGLEVLALDPREYSGSLTAVLMPAGHDADRVRKAILEAFDMSLGTGPGQARRQGVPHRPPGRLQRPHAHGHARRRRDGARACRRAGEEGRRSSGHGVSRRERTRSPSVRRPERSTTKEEKRMKL